MPHGRKIVNRAGMYLSPTMEIQHRPTGTKGSFVAISDGKEAGEMTYSMAPPDKMIIDHTGVNPGFEGMGVGKHMVMAAVAHARAQGIRIIPLCPFAKSVFDRNMEELADVRA